MKRCCFSCFNVCFAPPDINVLVFKITRQVSSIIRFFEQHFNVRYLGGGTFVDLRFQFQEGVDFKKWFEKLQNFEGVVKQRAFRHLSSQCLHDEKSGFIILDTLSGNVRDLPPLKMSKNNTSYFDMNLQAESGDVKRVVCFSKQR